MLVRTENIDPKRASHTRDAFDIGRVPMCVLRHALGNNDDSVVLLHDASRVASIVVLRDATVVRHELVCHCHAAQPMAVIVIGTRRVPGDRRWHPLGW